MSGASAKMSAVYMVIKPEIMGKMDRNAGSESY